MAPNDNIIDAGRRLGRDMRAIRQSRAITSDAVIRATKAAPNVVSEFEASALVDNPMYNRVYLRLFVRGYSQVIGIRTDDALRAVDEVLEGTYTDRLARVYLDRPGEIESGSKSTESAAPRQATPPAKEEPEEPDTPKKSAEMPESAPEKAKSAPDAPKKTPGKAPTGGGVAPKAASEKPAAKAVAKPKPRPKGKEKPKPSKTVLLPDSGSLLRTVGAVLGGLAVILAAWVLWPSGTEEPPQAAVVPVDTTRAPEPVLPPRVVLGDSVSFFVIAARDTLNPVRITPDGGVRRPHWIEILDSMEVRVADSLVIEGRLSAIDISVRDVLIPTAGGIVAGRLTMRKSDAQAYLDSLRTAGL